jgi:hypothetical protein
MLVTLWMQQPARAKRCPACLLSLKGSRGRHGADLHGGVLDAAPTGPLLAVCGQDAGTVPSITSHQPRSPTRDRSSVWQGCPPSRRPSRDRIATYRPEPAPAPRTECAAGLPSTSSPLRSRLRTRGATQTGRNGTYHATKLARAMQVEARWRADMHGVICLLTGGLLATTSDPRGRLPELLMRLARTLSPG